MQRLHILTNLLRKVASFVLRLIYFLWQKFPQTFVTQVGGVATQNDRSPVFLDDDVEPLQSQTVTKI